MKKHRLPLLLTALLTMLITINCAQAAATDQPEPGAITVTESVVIDIAPDEIWSTVRDFDALSLWHPAVEGSDITAGENNKPGAERHITLASGGTLDERLIAWDDQNMRYSYEMLDGALPVKNYRATIAVLPDGVERARVIWKGNFDAAPGHSNDEVRAIVARIYQAGLDNLKTMLAGDE